MKTYLLTIAYDGTGYCGWQRQNGQRSVQGEVENALCALLHAPVSVTASGRTDEGVHARAQAVSFACDMTVPAANLPAALNTHLPPSVRALRCKEMPDGFCARRSAKKKTYVYRFVLSDLPLPHCERDALRVPAPLDEALWQRLCEKIEGTHDFAAFCCAGSSAKTTVRTVYSCSFAAFPAVGSLPPFYEFTVCGNGFLYKMVRLLVGAILRVQSGKESEENFLAALAGNGNAIRKVPASPQGLTLLGVEY